MPRNRPRGDEEKGLPSNNSTETRAKQRREQEPVRRVKLPFPALTERRHGEMAMRTNASRAALRWRARKFQPEEAERCCRSGWHRGRRGPPRCQRWAATTGTRGRTSSAWPSARKIQSITPSALAGDGKTIDEQVVSRQGQRAVGHERAGGKHFGVVKSQATR